ncbi:MAG: DNA-3-methyladenine glycosylase I [Pseudomonadota bacterium]
MPDAAIPCAWAPPGDALYRAYHDTEWGVPERNGRALWEKLMLDGMQAGLAWITILRKRETMRAAFEGFEPARLATWGEPEIVAALENPGVIRSRAKISALVGNARAFLQMEADGTPFGPYCWAWVGGAPVVNQWRASHEAPASTPLSTEISKDLKRRGFKFVGPTIVYAWMQAVGLVNDHQTACPRHREVQALW